MPPLDHQAMPSARPAPFQNVAPGRRTHPTAKSMDAEAPPFLRLIRSFRHIELLLEGIVRHAHINQ